MSNFEKELLNRVSEIKTGEITPEGKKRTKKEKVIDDYLTVKLEYLKTCEAKEVSTLEFIQNYENNYEDLVKEYKRTKIEILKDEMAQMYGSIQNKASPDEIKSGAEALWQLNVVMINGFEGLSIGIDKMVKKKYNSEKTVSLKGLTKDTMEKEKLIKPVLAEIYDEYSEAIDAYLTPTAKLTLIYGQMLANRVALNNMDKDNIRDDENIENLENKNDDDIYI